MSITLKLNEEEVEILRAKHIEALNKIKDTMSALQAKKAYLQARIAELEGSNDVAPKFTETVKIPSLKEIGGFNAVDTIRQDLAAYKTLKHKIFFVFKAEHRALSTGETVEAIFKYFPQEKEKNHMTIIQSVSKILGDYAKQGIHFIKSDSDLDSKGKFRFTLIETNKMF